MRIDKLIVLVCVLFLSACGGKDVPVPGAHTQAYKVAVVMPRSLWESEKPVVQQALANVAKAQEGLPERVTLDLEWIDEDAANLEAEAYRITHDDSYAAIIGPKYSRDARLVARESMAYRIPVIMPSVTSAEVQRVYAGSNKTAPNVFCLSESDLAQTQALLSVMSRQMWVSRILLVSRDDEVDDYAASFTSYLSYFATELGFSKVQRYPFSDKESLRTQIKDIYAKASMTNFVSGLLFVPSYPEDLLWLDQILSEEKIPQDDGPNNGHLLPRIYCPDLACSLTLVGKLQHKYEGMALSGSPESGFPAARKAFCGEELQSGYAQLFDSVTLLCLALAHKQTAGLQTLREAIVAVMDACDGEGNKLGWTAEGLAEGFRGIRSGRIPSMAGASGSWVFDRETHISQLGTWYGYWRYTDGAFHLLDYYTRDDHAGKASMDQLWNWQSNRGWEQPIGDKGVTYEPLQDRYAVVMATSTGFTNYRHQADALDMYRLLKNAGYSDDHIVLITEDDIADNADNPHPGVVHVTPDGENLHKGIVYFFGTILLGSSFPASWYLMALAIGIIFVAKLDRGVGKYIIPVIAFLFFFLCLLFVMETCYSGSVGENLPGIPGLLMLTAAAPGEKSHADVLEDNIYLSNAFTRVFREQVEKNPDITLYDLYTELARHTTASHAMMYNAEWYGSVYENTVAEYFKLKMK